ncbi:hypothetical protein H2199_003748 [Coniosporium tulheliwenetii]|uniref:Uncharacterized protein n=1 Tax=Coniosporium tulheliwenetii TaxID=3383036 RepID=A0ACC2ZBW0_9PEZI|nr:hypothetical protein H2199_003748 [Cladosporium sp. JES 115]
MALRMQLGNIDKAYDVVKEVWRRRDAWEAMQAAMRSNSLKRGFIMSGVVTRGPSTGWRASEEAGWQEGEQKSYDWGGGDGVYG